MDKSNILAKAIKHYGQEMQIDKMVEEAAELITAIAKMRIALNSDEGITNEVANVIDELADVQIMTDQLTIMFGEANVNNRIAFKLTRLNQRIQDEQTK